MFKDYQPDLVMNDPVVKDMAKKYNKNVGQVCRLANICTKCAQIGLMVLQYGWQEYSLAG